MAMEAAALYALVQARQFAIVCFAYVSKQMAQQGNDFDKRTDPGSQAALQLIDHRARLWQQGEAVAAPALQQVHSVRNS
jgi:hypothetical protein